MMFRPFATFAVLAATALPAAAHHGWSGYDAATPLTLKGRVEAFSFANPHAHLRLATADKVWEVVLAPPSRMTVRGLPAGTIKRGDTVEVVGYAHREKVDELRAETIAVGGKLVGLR